MLHSLALRSNTEGCNIITMCNIVAYTCYSIAEWILDSLYTPEMLDDAKAEYLFHHGQLSIVSSKGYTNSQVCCHVNVLSFL